MSGKRGLGRSEKELDPESVGEVLKRIPGLDMKNKKSVERYRHYLTEVLPADSYWQREWQRAGKTGPWYAKYSGVKPGFAKLTSWRDKGWRALRDRALKFDKKSRTALQGALRRYAEDVEKGSVATPLLHDESVELARFSNMLADQLGDSRYKNVS